MNDYLNSLQKVLQSTNQLLNNQYHSLNSIEIHESASTLQNSAAECVVELRLATESFRKVLQNCFEDLEHSEQVWQSKQKIAEVPKSEIWNQIGEISGCQVRVQTIYTHYKINGIKSVRSAWESRIERLKNKYFINADKRLKTGIGWTDKEGFLEELYSEISLQAQELEATIRCGFKLISDEASIIYSDQLQELILLFDSKTKWKKKLHFEALAKEVEAKLDNVKKLSDGTYLIQFESDLRLTVGEWKNRWGDIGWEYVVRFRDRVSADIDSN